MKARFIGDPAERESGKPLSRPAEDVWFDVPEGMETKYRNHSHYETDDPAPVSAFSPAPKAAARKRKADPKPAPIETDGWEDDEA